MILPQRETSLVAKQAATLDLLSGGRLQMAVGVGWNYAEYEALGAEFTNRGKRLEEQIAVLRHLWTEPLVTLDGRYHNLDRVGINPLPSQRPIPLWIGSGPAELLAARGQLGRRLDCAADAPIRIWPARSAACGS